MDSEPIQDAKSRGGAWVLGIAGVVLALGIFIKVWPGHRRVEPFLVPKGASAQSVARRLGDARLVGSQSAFLVWNKLDPRTGPRPGVYMLSPGWTGYRIHQQLRKGPPLMRVTFPEGWTSRQMAALLESRGITPSAGFLALVEKEKREGFLFPDTYFFDQGVGARQVVDRMVQRFHQAEPADMMAQAKTLRLTYRQIVTLASLVEREARAPEERPIIAGVFLNRLRKRWRLESCATVEYALGSWKRQLTYKDLDVASPYNTYKHAGLPPGPICNPGKAALEAAAHPAPTEMMFFVADGKGTHRFSQYYKDHLAGKKQRGKVQ